MGRLATVGARAALVTTVVVTAVGCGGAAGPAAESPTPTPSATLELRTDGLGVVPFGEPMEEAFPVLVGLLGPPVDDIRVHGDLPYGYDGMDSTVRRVDLGGLYVVFGDWETSYREDGRMHLLGWGASERRTANGTVVETPEGIAIGASVVELEAAFGPSLDLTVDESCTGPPWYFVVESASRTGQVVSLSGSPSDPGTRLEGLFAGEQREGWAPSC